jgi:hypothetical protein
MPRLPRVLSTADLPRAELDALRLDGEAFTIGACVAPIDEIFSPELRAAALTAELPARLIAEQRTAAWVWGAILDQPRPHEVCADIAARARPSFDQRLRVREVVIVHDDVVRLSGTAVTTPIRTAIDLARFATVWGGDEVAIVRHLMEVGRFDVLDCARSMNRRRNLPGKRIALQRIALCGPPTLGQRPSDLA